MNKLWLRLALCVYALMYTVMLPLILGIENSYSDYHEIKPFVFPIITIAVSSGLWLHKKIEWKVAASFLIIVACFNHVNWPIIHNSAAIIFFIISTFIMIMDKRFSIFGILSAISYALLFINIDQNLFLFEVVQIPLISMYHASRVIYLIRLKNKQ